MRRIVKMKVLRPVGGGAGEREIAIITDITGLPVGLWELTEPEIRQAIEGRDFAYFEAASGSEELEIARQVPDQPW